MQIRLGFSHPSENRRRCGRKCTSERSGATAAEPCLSVQHRGPLSEHLETASFVSEDGLLFSPSRRSAHARRASKKEIPSFAAFILALTLTPFSRADIPLGRARGFPHQKPEGPAADPTFSGAIGTESSIPEMSMSNVTRKSWIETTTIPLACRRSAVPMTARQMRESSFCCCLEVAKLKDKDTHLD